MSSLLDRARRGETLTGLDIIDMHGHLGRYQFAVADDSPASLVATMDRIGVRTIVCSHLNCLRGNTQRGNDEVLAAMRAYPGRIEGYVSIWPSGAEQVEAEVRRRLGEGFVGIKIHNINQFSYTDDAYAPAMAIANERRLPVLLHTWGRDEEFDQVRELAGSWPEAHFLLAHAGAEKLERYVEAAGEFENVQLDTSFSLAPRGVVERLVAEAGAENVVWGSDATFLSMTQQIGRVVGAKISEEDKRKLLSLNARKLLDGIRGNSGGR
jgi:hypothetical protein